MEKDSLNAVIESIMKLEKVKSVAITNTGKGLEIEPLWKDKSGHYLTEDEMKGKIIIKGRKK